MAFDSLQNDVATAVTCLTSVAPSLESAQDTAALAEELSSCAGTNILNQDDASILATDVRSKNGTAVVSSQSTDQQIVLALSTAGTGVAQVGVTHARALLSTCWQVTVDLDTHTIQELSGTTCKESVITQINPTEQVAFEDLDLPYASPTSPGQMPAR